MAWQRKPVSKFYKRLRHCSDSVPSRAGPQGGYSACGAGPIFAKSGVHVRLSRFSLFNRYPLHTIYPKQLSNSLIPIT